MTKPAGARKKLLAKNFSLGSQFNGSRLAPSLLGSLHGLNCLSHEPKNGQRFIILAYIKLEVAGGPPLVGGGLPRRVLHGLSFIPVRDVPQPYALHRKRKSCHEAQPIIKAIPPQVPGLLGSPLNDMNEPERLSRTNMGTTCVGANSYLFNISLITG
ncbi:LOW QUALITY PROTEIN: hypothetical protein Cgig2_031577 [Carnegiea gigantea]|uniref:Uncharacterized protein n=1 Tax=Carnegiea gigantea TaxID=171969 RepID=A0A9Q1GPV1_9CARY|nr:LOW QUALITY PROTEIN: hypothetical protein Cgig2_031577 [Carnegiea gigantea]